MNDQHASMLLSLPWASKCISVHVSMRASETESETEAGSGTPEAPERLQTEERERRVSCTSLHLGLLRKHSEHPICE